MIWYFCFCPLYRPRPGMVRGTTSMNIIPVPGRILTYVRRKNEEQNMVKISGQNRERYSYLPRQHTHQEDSIALTTSSAATVRALVVPGIRRHAFHLLRNASCIPRLSLGLFPTLSKSIIVLFLRLQGRKHRPKGRPRDHPRPLSAWPLATDRRP